MRIKLKDISLNYYFFPAENEAVFDIFLFHGFSGSALDWEFIIPQLKKNSNIFAVDLIGHGQSDKPFEQGYYSFASIIEQIDELIIKLATKKIILIGYSMGGRVAVSYTAKLPEKISGLILESTSLGITDMNLKKERILKDNELADFIIRNGIEAFVDYWINLDLFRTQNKLSQQTLAKIKQMKLNNDKTGLANSLYGYGTGKMNIETDSIRSSKIQVLLITGEHDIKFTSINEGILQLWGNARHIIIPDAGHNVHLEQPDLFYNVINDFLNKTNFL